MQPLTVVTRSNRIECIHYGYLCITDSDKNIKYHIGDPNTKIYLRSSTKPFIAVALVESGAISKFGISSEELAVICSSHSGQDFHRNAIESILKKIGLNENFLLCGCASPANVEEEKQLTRENKRPSPLFNCCSGKHSGMLALCKFYGFPVENYNNVSHPAQKLIFNTIMELIGCNEEDILLGVDACTAPGYMISLYHHSYLYSLLAAGFSAKSKYRNSLGLINKAMRDNPRMVIGDGEFCTDLMINSGNKVIGKVGAEGVYCVSIPEKSLGICIKIADGEEKAESPVIISILKHLGVLSKTEIQKLKTWAYPEITNHKGSVTGNILPVIDLEQPFIQDLVSGQKIEFENDTVRIYTN